MKRIVAPVVDPRGQERILAELQAQLAGYVPDWSPREGTTSLALMRIFARYTDILGEGLNALPERHLLAFLDTLGISLLPAQAARVPLVFTLLPDSAADATLPKNSQCAAPPRPVTPSPLQPRPEPAAQPQPVVFATEQTVTLSRGKLALLYSIQPGDDLYADHTTMLTDGFTLFEDMKRTPHEMYLGHDELFKLAGDINLILHFAQPAVTRREVNSAEGTSPMEGGEVNQPTPARPPLDITWEYLTDMGWLPLESLAHEDTTLGLSRTHGQMVLRRTCGPDAKEETIHGRTSYWLRGRLKTPLPPQGVNNQHRAPLVDTIRATVQFNKDGLQPEAAFADTSALDTSKNFYPFGPQPARYSTFYLASKEVFQRKGASVRINVSLPNDVQQDLSGDVTVEGNYLFRFKLASNFATLLDAAQIIGSEISEEPTETTSPDISEEPTETTSLDISEDFQKHGFVISSKAKVIVEKPGSKWKIVDDDRALYIRNQADGLGVYTLIVLKWEYYNGNAWTGLNINRDYQFTDNRIVTFTCPRDWTETDVNGEPNYWLRVRIVEGDYGQPLHATASADDPEKVILVDSTLKPPVVSTLSLGYSYRTDVEDLDHCVTYNDFVLADHSDDCRRRRRTFKPFQPVSERQPAVHFGFDRPLPSGLLSLYVHIPYREGAVVDDGSPYIWEYRTERGWEELGVLDETSGFQRSGMIQFVGPPDAAATDGLGEKPLYRIRARLKRGERLAPAPVGGVWLNAVWSSHRQAFTQDILGQSDGNPHQILHFPPQRTPVLEGEVVEVREWAGQGRAWEVVERDLPQDGVRKERDPATDAVRALWVRWQRRPHLFAAGPRDRVYTIERASGWLRFGDGRRGMIPPAGARIVATYSAGGGQAGNVAAHKVEELRTAVSGIMSVTNPVPASGGTAPERAKMVNRRGPQSIRHQRRAVAAEDFEWLAHEASPAVARARCLPLLGPDGKAQRGWVTLVIVPYGAEDEAQPRPTADLLRRVRQSLDRHAPASVVGQIRLVGPVYVPVSVRAEIVPLIPGEAAQIEERVRNRLAGFLHPLTGGPQSEGWEFGRSLHLSQIASVIENTRGVDYAREILLLSDGELFGEIVPVDDNALLASGRHEIKLTLGVA